MNGNPQTSRSTGYTFNSNFNANIPQWSYAIIIEEEDIGMRKCKRKRNVDITNEEVKGSISELEEIKIRKCSRKSHVDIINEEMEGSSSEEEYIGMRKCRREINSDIINKLKEAIFNWNRLKYVSVAEKVTLIL